LNLAKAKGLRTHGAYVDVSMWGKYGQWGHLEYLDQDPNIAVKWNFLRGWPGEVAGLRSVDEPAGAVPQFVTQAKMASAVYGQVFSQDIVVGNGDGALTLDCVGQLLTPGLSISNSGGTPPQLRVSGIPTAAGPNYILARVRDSDGDPAWRTFYFQAVGGPGTILQCSFEGVNPALNLPWLATYVLSGATYSGWTKGAGITPVSGNDALVWWQHMPADEPSSTLGYAITNNAYWQFTITPSKPLDLRGAEVRFTIQRIDYHAPREYAVFTSIGGFTNGAQLFDTGHFTDTGADEFVFTLPSTAAYSNVTAACTFRLYGYSGQYDSHRTSLLGFKLTSALGTLPAFDQWKVIHGIPTTASNNSDSDGDGIPLLLEYALNLDPNVFNSTGLPTGGISNGYLTLTYTRVKAATDIVYSAEVSDSPGATWSGSAANVDQNWIVVDQGAVQSVTARDKTPMSAARSRFIRLDVVKP